MKTQQRNEQIRALAAAGASRDDLAGKFGLAVSTIRKICAGVVVGAALLGSVPASAALSQAEHDAVEQFLKSNNVHDSSVDFYFYGAADLTEVNNWLGAGQVHNGSGGNMPLPKSIQGKKVTVAAPVQTLTTGTGQAPTVGGAAASQSPGTAAGATPTQKAVDDAQNTALQTHADAININTQNITTLAGGVQQNMTDIKTLNDGINMNGNYIAGIHRDMSDQQTKFNDHVSDAAHTIFNIESRFAALAQKVDQQDQNKTDVGQTIAHVRADLAKLATKTDQQKQDQDSKNAAQNATNQKLLNDDQKNGQHYSQLLKKTATPATVAPVVDQATIDKAVQTAVTKPGVIQLLASAAGTGAGTGATPSMAPAAGMAPSVGGAAPAAAPSGITAADQAVIDQYKKDNAAWSLVSNGMFDQGVAAAYANGGLAGVDNWLSGITGTNPATGQQNAPVPALSTAATPPAAAVMGASAGVDQTARDHANDNTAKISQVHAEVVDEAVKRDAADVQLKSGIDQNKASIQKEQTDRANGDARLTSALAATVTAQKQTDQKQDTEIQTVKTAADNADKHAGIAEQKADSAEQHATKAETKADNAVMTANHAEQVAGDAKNVANRAEGKADHAEQVANGVDAKATSAVSTAQRADTHATQALNQVQTFDNRITSNSTAIHNETQARIEGDRQTLEAANAYTNSKFANIDKKIGDVDKRAKAGSAAALAAVGLPGLNNGQTWNIGAGVGEWSGAAAVAVGGNYRVSEHVAFKVGATASPTTQDYGAFAGISIGN